ncbi:TadE/TadG family type IV pilus assembly protein [Brevundimonas sp.]|uniref:TadE/TadG family type IV pilus assembly protein n=1 Tax=Brevundimonas sp. TaxID=1871086 RepID=UPI0025E3B744|nr:TadE/TadG family type IV pilus assembly protein [Brevundimonas sp.]
MAFWTLVRRLFGSRAANVAPIFALCVIPMAAAAGAGIDYSRAASARSHMQDIADAAALRVMRDSQLRMDQRRDLVRTIAQSQWEPFQREFGDLDWQARIEPEEAEITLDLAVPTVLMGLVGIDEMPVEVSATARAQTRGLPLCLLVLNRTAKDAVRNAGAGAISAPDCRVHINSSNSNALHLGGGTTLTSAENCIVGQVKLSGGSTYSPLRLPTCQPMDDPFANIWRPTSNVCDFTNRSVTGSGVQVLTPGTYCGGITINMNGGATAQFQPGVYRILGKFSFTGSGRMEGQGVSFFLDGSGSGLDWTGSAGYTFTAPTSGQSAGILISLNPNATSPLASSTITGSGRSSFDGVIHLPRQKLLIRGFESVDLAYGFALVVDTMEFYGRSSLNMRPSPVPIPAGVSSTSGSPYLVR